MKTLQPMQKNIVFLLSAVAACLAWLFLRPVIAVTLWPSIFDDHKRSGAFELASFFQWMIFWFMTPITACLLLSWMLGLWKPISLRKSVLLTVICLMLPSVIESSFAMFLPKQGRVAYITIGSQK